MRSPTAGWLVSLAVLLSVAVQPARSQVAPTPAEIAAYTDLHRAAQRGDVAGITRLAAASPGSLEARDSNGRTALHVATFASQRGAIRALLRAGANSSAFESGRYDAVTIAAVANDEESLRVLLALGASAKLITSRYDGTALIAAAHLGHHGVVQQLIDAGAPVDHVNNLHWTALIEAIVLGDGGVRHQRCVQALLAAGANAQLADSQGHTPLQLARQRGFDVIVGQLSAAGVR